MKAVRINRNMREVHL